MTTMTAERRHALALGARLREVRRESGLSLMQVEEKSGDQFKAVVVGSYERGDRNPTVIRLIELAAFYGVQPADLLPREDVPELTPVEEAQHLLRAAADRLDALLPAGAS